MSNNFFSSFENLDKSGDKDKNVARNVNVDRNVNIDRNFVRRQGTKFTHSIYGMIIAGPKKGSEVEIRYILPSKIEVEVGMNIDIRSSKSLNIGDVVNNCVILSKTGNETYLSHCKRSIFFKEDDLIINNNEVMILGGDFRGQRGIIKSKQLAKVGVAFMDGSASIFNLSDIFYKDLLLQNGKYFNVIDVSSETISGKELGNNSIKTITLKDVKQMMSGFKLRDYIQESKQIEDANERIFMQNELSSELGSESGSESDNEQDNDFGSEPDNEPESKTSFKDIQRTSVVFSGWTRQQKDYIKIITNIVNNLGINEDNMNMSSILDDIQASLEHFTKKIYNTNFDILNSSIDIHMIIACIVAYNVIKNNEFNFSSMKEYVNHLFKSGYFVGDVNKSVLVELPDVFPCKNLKRTKVNLEKINMLMDCFHTILQNVLNRVIDINRGKRSVIEYEPIRRRENKYEKRRFLLPSDLKNISKEDVNKKILWNPTYKDRIQRWRSHIKSKEESSKEGIKKNIYKFIEKNIETSPLVLFSLRMEVIEFLKSRYPDTMELIMACNNDKQCEEDVITKYIKMTIDSVLDKRGKSREVSNEDYEMLQRYKNMRDFTKQFIEDIEKVEEYAKQSKEDKLKELSSDLGSRSSVRTIKSPRERMINWLSNKFGYKLDNTCKDDLCKDRDISNKLKEILSKYKNKLSDAEIDMAEDFISKIPKDISPKTEQRKIPKIILKLKKPQVSETEGSSSQEQPKIPKIILRLNKPDLNKRSITNDSDSSNTSDNDSISESSSSLFGDEDEN
jgi:hypothetical protein